jgi:hypothetical protein
MTAAVIGLAVALAGLLALVLALARCWQLKSRLIDQEWRVVDLVIEHDEETAALTDEVYRLDERLCEALWEIERRRAS